MLSVSIDGIYKQLCQPTRAVFGTWRDGLLFGINGHPVLMIDEGSMSKQQSAKQSQTGSVLRIADVSRPLHRDSPVN
jgi:hypothetical protein